MFQVYKFHKMRGTDDVEVDSYPLTVYAVKGNKDTKFLVFDPCDWKWEWINAENCVPADLVEQ